MRGFSMLDIKLIRKNPQALDAMLEKRGASICSQALLDLDQKKREAIAQAQCIQTERNTVIQSIGQLKAAGQLVNPHVLAHAAHLKSKESELSDLAQSLEKQVQDMLIILPNFLHDDVPFGFSEDENKEILRWKDPEDMPWAKDHVALGLSSGGIDFEQASKVSGTRFCYLKGDIARLERALGQWMLDVHVQEFGFTEMATPYLVKSDAMFGAGQLPKFAQDLFCTKDERYLIPTAEVSLVNWVRERTFSPEDLPLCLTGLTPCFRAEAGASGRDTQGMIRQHQFNKVELVVVCQKEDVDHWHGRMIHQAEILLERLNLPYRKVILCSGDTGTSAQKTYDLEVWLPGQKKYREIASCSQCGDYQGRRLQAKIKYPKGESSFVHTLNGSGLPTGRTLIAIMENYQTPEGNILIPPVLFPYVGECRMIKGA